MNAPVRAERPATVRPHVLLSAAVSLDGYLDGDGPERLLLSGPEDFDRVDSLRADHDAILVGAGTLRRDDPRLRVRSAARRADRVRRGLPEHPLRVAVTASGALDPGLNLWRGGGTLLYAPGAAAPGLRDRLGPGTDVVAIGTDAGADGGTDGGVHDGGDAAGGADGGRSGALDWGAILDDLGRRGVRRLMVEGGGTVHTRLVAAGLADEIRLAVAPVLVGRPGAPRFLGPADYPGGPASRMRLLGTETAGDVVVLRYAPKDRAEAEDRSPEDRLPEDPAPEDRKAPEDRAPGDLAPEDRRAPEERSTP